MMFELPIDQLVVSIDNVRQDREVGIENLATLIASIRSVGLLQPLVVARTSDPDRFEVVAGRRRLSALTELAKQGHTIDPVPCVEILRADSAEASLAENYAREQMHPADLYRAFARVLDANPDYDEKTLVTMFDLNIDRVRRTLRLGRLHPTILDAYRENEINDQIAQAFAATEDQQLQASVFEQLSGSHFTTSLVKKMLGVGAEDLKLKLVGLDTYGAAGGRFERDLFETHNQLAGRVLDLEILDRLATEKMIKLLADRFPNEADISFSFETPKDQYGYRNMDLHIPSPEQEPPGLKVVVPSLVYSWNENNDERIEAIDLNLYWTDKQAKKDAYAAANEGRSEAGKDPVAGTPPEKEKGGLTGRATDFLAKLRGDVLYEAAADATGGLQIHRFLFLHAANHARLTWYQSGMKHISTGRMVPDWIQKMACLKEPDFDAFMKLPPARQQEIASLLIAGLVDNHRIAEKKPTWIQTQFGKRAQENARFYWEPDAEFFDIFKKAQIIELVKEVSSNFASILGNMKVAEVKETALHFFTGKHDAPRFKEATAAELKAAKEWVPSWLKLAPPAPKAKRVHTKKKVLEDA